MDIAKKSHVHSHFVRIPGRGGGVVYIQAGKLPKRALSEISRP